MPTTRHVVAVTEPVSNSITTAFNSYKLTFSDEHAFNQTFSSFRSRRRIIGTMSCGLVNGVWTEWIDFTVRDGPPWWNGTPDQQIGVWGQGIWGQGLWGGTTPGPGPGPQPSVGWGRSIWGTHGWGL